MYEQQKELNVLESRRDNYVQEIFDLGLKHDTASVKYKSLMDRIEDKQQTISVLEQAAKEKEAILEAQYRDAEAELERQLQTYKMTCDKTKKDIEDNLKKAESTVVALNNLIIKANQERESINQNRLNVSEQDISDIKLLQNIRDRFSNPRVISKLIWQSYYQPIAKSKFVMILNDTTKTGVYKITNIQNEKIYIGQAVDIYKRWCDHCKCGCGIDTPANNKLYKAMLEDGLYNFRFELLEECPREQLNEKEKYYINLYQTVTYGYNAQGGNS